MMNRELYHSGGMLIWSLIVASEATIVPPIGYRLRCVTFQGCLWVSGHPVAFDTGTRHTHLQVPQSRTQGPRCADRRRVILSLVSQCVLDPRYNPRLRVEYRMSAT
ncbi:hypothetical protein K491DRAFT_369237 [Lophiostoma macrostomum CBS 122681]|uniref:Secreted protein n=1 Tax=Lophiostoma macrostomum CBS 122681 TaxID=1314788 RepID=A0A6A6TCD5_9PLEO|nr:hypothetical protein K491DRAFT_369237 [Lophiostoma macrostomum CBS 122681]